MGGSTYPVSPIPFSPGTSHFHLHRLLHPVFFIHPQNVPIPAQLSLPRFQCDVFHSQFSPNVAAPLSLFLSLKPATGRPCVLALVDSGTVPAFTCDCLHLRGDVNSNCVCRRLREQCLRSTKTSVARVAHVLLLRFVAGNVDVNTLASKCSELLGNTEILRMRRIIHKSTCVCLHLPVATITQKRRDASFDLWPALHPWSASSSTLFYFSANKACLIAGYISDYGNFA